VFAILCFFRELVEPYASARAAERITPRQIKLLEASCRRYRALEEQIPGSAGAVDLWRIHHALIEEEQVFHGTILEAAGNSLLAGLVQLLHLLGQVRHNFAVSTLGRNPDVAREHQHIVAALRSRQPELAGARMLEHLQNGRTLLEERLRQGSPAPEADARGARAFAGNVVT
jgi:DNA-binding GntR family transcriptional regulator